MNKMRITRETSKTLLELGHPIYHNNRILICKKYSKNNISSLFKDILDIFSSMFISLGYIIITPLLLIYGLWSYFPKLNIIDDKLDEEKQEEMYETNMRMEELFQKYKNKDEE
jgi:hypothetical protein